MEGSQYLYRPVLLTRVTDLDSALGKEMMASRRDLLKVGAMAAMAEALPSSVTFADPTPEQHKPVARNFWPDGARMVISVSLQMEGGAQPASGAESPMPKIDPKYPDLPASKWYDSATRRVCLGSSKSLTVARSRSLPIWSAQR